MGPSRRMVHTIFAVGISLLVLPLCVQAQVASSTSGGLCPKIRAAVESAQSDQFQRFRTSISKTTKLDTTYNTDFRITSTGQCSIVMEKNISGGRLSCDVSEFLPSEADPKTRFRALVREVRSCLGSDFGAPEYEKKLTDTYWETASFDKGNLSVTVWIRATKPEKPEFELHFDLL